MRISDWSSDVCSSDLTIYNCNLVIGADGSLLGRHRKLVPTWAEKLTWAGGDGASIRVYDTPVGPLGTLACGENTNTLADRKGVGEGTSGAVREDHGGRRIIKQKKI